MAAYLMTHSLLSSWLYAIKDDPYADATSERDPMAEFMQVLRREPTETTEAMQKGIDFENLVTDIVMGRFSPTFETDGTVNKSSYGNGEVMGYNKYPTWYEAANKVADIVRGGQLQYKARRHITVSGMDFVLYGRLDCLKAGTIVDIKFSSKYDRGKYFDSTQHPTYMEIIPEAVQFVYVISNGTEVWTEPYRRDEVTDIKPIISDFISWLDAVGLMPVYKEKWLAL